MKASETNRNRIDERLPGARRFLTVRAGLAAALLLALAGSVGAADFPQGLMLQFSFDEAPSGGKISDSSGRGHDGRAQGATWTAAGKRGGGFAFAASNQCIVVTNYPALRLKQATYAVWFQASASNGAARVIFDKARDPRCALGIAGETPKAKEKGRLRAVAGGLSCLGDNVVADGNWHHAAVTFDGAKARLYVDGQAQKQEPAQFAEPSSGNDNLVIGMNNTGTLPGEIGQSFNGAIDDVMIFNHALTEAEVGAVMTSVKPKFTKSQVASRLAELKGLLDRGLILQDFYDRKVKECEAAQ